MFGAAAYGESARQEELKNFNYYNQLFNGISRENFAQKRRILSNILTSGAEKSDTSPQKSAEVSHTPTQPEQPTSSTVSKPKEKESALGRNAPDRLSIEDIQKKLTRKENGMDRGSPKSDRDVT